MDEHHWVNENIALQKGKTIIITGANSGIGFEAAKILAGKGAQIILACRNTDKAYEARKNILSVHPSSTIDVAELDLSSLSSIQGFAANIKETISKLDVLINNAGVMAMPFETTTDGFEMQLGTNHLGHFALTAQLFPLLKGTAGSRIVNLSSAMHWVGMINFDNLNFESGKYNPWKAYGQSKLANMLFTFELQRRFEKHKINMLAISAHPGYSATNLQHTAIKHNESFWKNWLVTTGNGLLATTPVLGSLPTVFAATDQSLHGGEYIGPSKWFNTRGEPGKNVFSEKARDASAAQQLWEVSQKLTRVHFPLDA